MLSFNNIGNLGRISNQMFQYAALKGIAAKHDYEYCIPPKKFLEYLIKMLKWMEQTSMISSIFKKLIR